MEDLTRHLAEILEAARDRGFELPLFLTAVAINGCLMHVKYTQSEHDEGLDCELLAQHVPEGDSFLVPINIMLLDQAGQAARVVIEAGQRPRFGFNGH